MPKVIEPEPKARAVRLVLEHRTEYPTMTAAVLAVSNVRGREKVPTGGQVGVPAGGLIEVPTLRVVS